MDIQLERLKDAINIELRQRVIKLIQEKQEILVTVGVSRAELKNMVLEAIKGTSPTLLIQNLEKLLERD